MSDEGPSQQPGHSLVVAGPAEYQLSRTVPEGVAQGFEPLPPPTGSAPYRLDLAAILGPGGGQPGDDDTLRLHVIGDSGGVKQPVPQQLVADVMTRDLANPQTAPVLCYHVGDVVYYNGELSQYYAQFYEPYAHYTPPIAGVTGNHDLSPLTGSPDPPGAAFARTFCATSAQVLPESQDAPRTTMIQPNVYWTLLAPQATIIGLATNVPEGGMVAPDQQAWLAGELEAAATDRSLIVALHHPPYSADSHHGGSARMGAMLDDAFAKSGRLPDLVLSGHVHNYQRFTRTVQGRQLPYVVVGASGYWHLHAMARTASGDKIEVPWDVPGTDVVLESYAADRHGFLRLIVGEGGLAGEYVTVPRPQESWSNGPVTVVDRFRVDTATHTVIGG